jgi:hypothetical protein
MDFKKREFFLDNAELEFPISNMSICFCYSDGDEMEKDILKLFENWKK